VHERLKDLINHSDVVMILELALYIAQILQQGIETVGERFANVETYIRRRGQKRARILDHIESRWFCCVHCSKVITT